MRRYDAHRLRARLGLFLLMALSVPLLVPATIHAQSGLGSYGEARRLEETLARVADRVRPSVVAIRAHRRMVLNDDAGGRSHRRLSNRTIPAVGSGMLISNDGKILTNEHVIQNAKPEDIEVLMANGDAHPVLDITSDPRSDLAVLRIDVNGASPVTFCEIDRVQQGHFAIVMGNPFGAASDNLGTPSMSFGVVSALGQVLTDQLDPMRNRYYGNLIQTDARINPGNSGGPLMNIRGEVIGITTAISTRSGGDEGIGYAIPIDRRVKAIIDDLTQGREVQYSYLGVYLVAPSAKDRQTAGSPPRQGALVDQISFGTPAHDAGLKEGDVITSFNRTAVNNVDHLVRLVGASRAGASVPIEYYRKGEKSRADVTPTRKTDVLPGLNIHTVGGVRFANAAAQVVDWLDLDDEAESVVVLDVLDDSPGEKAGFKRGQKIAAVNGRSVRQVSELREALNGSSGTAKITLDGSSQDALTLPAG